jgi:hypothetical protein
METHADHRDHRYMRLPETTTRRTTGLTPAEWIETGVGAGILAGLVMTLPLLLWDWAKPSHLALELPTAATAWLFGLQHFSHQTYHFWPIVLGFAFLCLGCERRRLHGHRRPALRHHGDRQEPRPGSGVERRQLHLLLVHAAADRSRRRSLPRHGVVARPVRRSRLGLGRRFHRVRPCSRSVLCLAQACGYAVRRRPRPELSCGGETGHGDGCNEGSSRSRTAPGGRAATRPRGCARGERLVPESAGRGLALPAGGSAKCERLPLVAARSADQGLGREPGTGAGRLPDRVGCARACDRRTSEGLERCAMANAGACSQSVRASSQLPSASAGAGAPAHPVSAGRARLERSNRGDRATLDRPTASGPARPPGRDSARRARRREEWCRSRLARRPVSRRSRSRGSAHARPPASWPRRTPRSEHSRRWPPAGRTIRSRGTRRDPRRCARYSAHSVILRSGAETVVSLSRVVPRFP